VDPGCFKLQARCITYDRRGATNGTGDGGGMVTSKIGGNFNEDPRMMLQAPLHHMIGGQRDRDRGGMRTSRIGGTSMWTRELQCTVASHMIGEGPRTVMMDSKVRLPSRQDSGTMSMMVLS
jgi:hypothetical protein